MHRVMACWRWGRAVGLSVALLLPLVACGEREGVGGATSAARSAEPPLEPPGLRKVLSIVDDLGWCDIDHRGILLDLGTDAVAGRYAGALVTPQGVVATEHEGATWARVYDGKLSLTFVQPYAARVFVSLRAAGQDARRADISIDDLPIGQVSLSREDKIVSTSATRLPIDAGLHELTLRFRGSRGADDVPYAEVDWIRVAVPDELSRSYGAPTLYDVRAPAAQLGGVPRRALALRAPTTVACTLRVPSNATFRAGVGMMGGGKATAAIAVREDGAEPVELRRIEVEGGDAAAWTDVDVSLASYAGRILRLEVSASETSGTGRLMFGDPAVFVPERLSESVPRAKTAVLVVFDGVARADLPPWLDDAPHAPNLAHLVATGTVFDDHRGTSTLANASLAALLTGLPPRALAFVDAAARLPKVVTTLGDFARQGSVRAAMFTAVPTTSAAFGFERHWESFFSYPPNEGKAGTAAIDDATAWLSDVGTKENEARPMLAVIHARGGHPPWDLTPAETAKLPPQKYAGALRARDAAQSIASLHGNFAKLAQVDEERLRAMHFAAFYGQDAALGRLIRKLHETGRWDSTLLIVTADVSSAMRTLFADGLPLSEGPLSLPLYVHFPGSPSVPSRVALPTSPPDVTRTILASLGLKAPPELGGYDLAAVAAGKDDDPYGIRVAYAEDTYSARWGNYVLSGKLDGRRPMLCDTSRDPTCAYDRSHRAPFVTHALFRRFSALDAALPKAPEREPSSLDSETAAAFKVWGLY